MTDWTATLQQALDLLARRDMAAARTYLEQVIDNPGAPATAWMLLADARAGTGDMTGCEQAIDGALKLDGRNVPALLAKGELAVQRGDDRSAASFLSLGLGHAPADASPALQRRLAKAQQLLSAAQGRFADHLQGQLRDAGLDREQPQRFAEALDILLGRQAPQLQQPTSFFYPGLPQTAFYDTAEFPWIAELERAAPAMKAELEALLASRADFQPYVQAEEGRANRGHSLLNDPRWSALYLWRNGRRVEEHAQRCPATMQALEAVPTPMITDRAPNILFSLLRPKTHIPPHWGMLNTRLICHIPLIVPEGCRLRVGNHERRVEAGKALLFDDSIEHEAWNDSDETRVVLLLEVWNPALSQREREALTAMFGAIGLYGEG